MTRKSKLIPNTFFDRHAEVVAQELLGKTLCVRKEGKIEKLLITETEAYIGPHDLASHASKGRTKRTEVMFHKAGTIYIYLIYGMYTMFNIVTGEKDYPAAVLIRGAGKYDGPGKLTKGLSITRDFNDMILGSKTGIWIEEGIHVSKTDYDTTPRIGVSYAKEWAHKPLRFVLIDKMS